MTEKTDLIPLENPQPSALFAPGGLEPILARIEAQARIGAERKAKADADAKRQADQSHRERIHAEIVEDIELRAIGGLADWAGNCIVKAIEEGRIRHLTINY